MDFDSSSIAELLIQCATVIYIGYGTVHYVAIRESFY